MRKRKAIGWESEEGESATATNLPDKRIKEDCRLAMDTEFNCDIDNSYPSTIIVIDEDATQENINACRYILHPLYNDQILVDRELAHSLLNLLLCASPYYFSYIVKS